MVVMENTGLKISRVKCNKVQQVKKKIRAAQEILTSPILKYLIDIKLFWLADYSCGLLSSHFAK